MPAHERPSLATVDAALRLFSPTIRAAVSHAATLPLPALITGETGTGKTTVAKAIHQLSKRSTGPFVEVDCATLTPTLIEAELYGNERGAYTDAKASRVGLVQLADRGTLFLDEIGEIPYTAQSKLLRVVDRGEFRRVGSGATKRVDIRIVAATHRDLVQLVQRKRFRSDLFWRCYGVHIHLLPVREQPQELRNITRKLVERCMERHLPNQPIPNIGDGFIEALTFLRLPGNLRELNRIVTLAILASNGADLRPHHIPPDITDLEARFAAHKALRFQRGGYRRRSTSSDERKAIVDALRKTHGNKTAAARVLGMSRTVLYERLRLHAIASDEYRGATAHAALTRLHAPAAPIVAPRTTVSG